MTIKALAATITNNDPSTARPDPLAALSALTTAIATNKTNADTADTDLATVVGADQTAVEAAVAALEGDGASPTQAHVTALRGVWNTLKTDAATAKTATAATKTTSDALSAAAATTAVSSDVTLLFNPATVVTRNALKTAVDALLRLVLGSDALA